MPGVADDQMNKYDAVIIGSGPAGLTAAIYLSRGGFKVLVLTGNQPGGQLVLTTNIENYPGFESVAGPELMSRMQKQVEKFGTEVVAGEAVSIRNLKRFVVKTQSNKEYFAKVVIVATGASAKWLNVPGVGRLRGKGISVCATCDAPFFKDKVAAVVGGGDTAFTEAEFLTRFAKKIYLIHRREKYRAEKIIRDRVLASKKIKPLVNTQVKKFLGENKLKTLELETIGKGKWRLAVDGCFIAIGHKPNTDFLKARLPARQGFLDLDEKGYVKVHNEVFTSVDGVFAAGDCVDWKYKQAITAAGMGCKAAIEAREWLRK